jgi:formylglycine-generating enzyme required for sulfatase activity
MARLVYDLDGKYAAFRSGFRVRAGNDSPFVAEVWGDGKRLWESGDLVPLGVAGATADVDVRGVRELTLIVAGDDGKRHALLIEPRLTLVSIAAPPAGATVGNAPPPAVAPFDAAQARAHQEAWAKHLGTTVETVNSVGQKMILIPPGEFLMGSTDEQLEALRKITEELKIDAAEMTRVQQRERPQHRVVITKPFRLSATEVTVGQFKKFVAATGYRTEAETIAPKQVNLNTATDDLPTAGITWSDAEAYCKWLSEQEKATYRLPTEAEWEFACRAGTATQYSFGDDAALLDQYEWNYKNSRSQLQSAGTKLPNGFGLYDMHGSLHEWCRDYFAANWYGASPPNDPIAPQTGSEHVTRGGNYWAYSNALQCRSAYRGSMPAANKYSFLIGFRCARELDVPAVAASTTSPKPPSPGVVSPVPKPTPTGTQPPPEATGVSPAAPRWPLAPSKPEDIVWLQGLKATLTLRAPSAFGGGPTDVQVKPGEPLPGGAATIVGINFGRDNAALMTDDVLKRTATLVDLEDLNLSYAKSAEQVTKDGLPQLAALVNLRRLNLERIGAKETDPAFLERFVKLESLRLGSQPFLNLEQHIARLPALAELHLNKMDLTNLRRLGPLPRLTELGLGDYGAAEGSKRHEAAKQYAPLVPWCRITVFGPNTPDPRVVIEPTASPPGN